jgi:type I restriction enzyme M protein
MLGAELASLNETETRIQTIDTELEELLENLDEEDKQDSCINEEGSAWVSSEIKKRAKNISVQDATSFEQILLKANDLFSEQKQLKKTLKNQAVDLENLTKETIEGLSIKECKDLLGIKWINPLFENLEKIPHDVVAEFISKIQKLADKYSATYSDVCDEIKQAETDLVSMIDQLTGDEFDMAGLAEFKKLLGGE